VGNGMAFWGRHIKPCSVCSIRRLKWCPASLLLRAGARFGSGLLACLAVRLDDVEMAESGRQEVIAGRDAFVAGRDLTVISMAAQDVPLAVAVKDLSPVLAKVEMTSFAGRQWLADLVDSFMALNPCGYVLIEAEAGMGKTTFAAWLASTRSYISHFSMYSDGWSVTTGLANLTGQLIGRFDIAMERPGIVSAWAQSPAGFESVLTEAAQRARDGGHGPLVIVADGLDEAATPDGGLPWGLPSLLPQGVFVVATYKSGLPLQRPIAPLATLTIARDSPGNRDDIREYLAVAACSEGLAPRLAAAGLTPSEFTTMLAQRCDGVWIWLRYALEEIRLGMRLPTEISALPVRLRDYYADKLRAWRQDPAWDTGLLRVLATLGAAGEPLTLAMLARLADAASAHVRRWCDWTLRPLLAVSLPPGGRAQLRYAIYHASFRELLNPHFDEDVSSSNGVTSEELSTSAELAEAAAAAHSRICDSYLACFGTLAAGLPVLAADPAAASVDDGYPLRYLSQHLIRAGRSCDVHALLAAEGPSAGGTGSGVGKRNVWFNAHDVAGDVHGYLADLRLARDVAKSVGRQLRYALMLASVTSLSAALPPVLISELVKRGGWSAALALGHIERIADEDRQARALAGIIPHLPRELLGRVLMLVRRFHDPNTTTLLKALAPHIPDALLGTAIKVTLDESFQSQVPLAALLARLSREQLSELTAQPGQEAQRHVRALLAFFSSATVAEGFGRALAEIPEIEFNYHCDALVAALAPYLPADLLDDVLACLDTVRRPDLALEALAEHTLAEQLQQLVAYTQRRDPTVEFVRIIASRLPSHQVDTVLKLCQAVPEPERRAEAFTAIARHLDEETARRLLAPGSDSDPCGTPASDFAVIEFLDLRYGHKEKYQLLAVGALLDRLPGDEARTLVRERVIPLITEHARRHNLHLPEINELIFVADEYACVAAYLPADLRQRALAEICKVMGWSKHDAESRALFLSRFAPLTDDEISFVLSALENAIPETWWPDSGLMVADTLAPLLQPRQLADVLHRVQRFPIEPECFTALASIGLLQPAVERHETAARALVMARSMSHESSHAKAIIRLAPLLDPSLAEEAFEQLRSIFPMWGLPAIDALADIMPLDQLLDVLTSDGTFLFDITARDKIPRIVTRLAREGHADVIDYLLPSPPNLNYKLAARLAPLLSPAQARRCWNLQASTEVLSALVARLDTDVQAAAVDELLATRELSITTESDAVTLGRLCQAAPTELLAQAVGESMRRASPVPLPSVVLEQLAPALPERLVEDALRYALRFDHDCCQALVKLAPRLSGTLLDEAIMHACQHRHSPHQAAALTALSGRLPAGNGQRDEILAAALDAIASWPASLGHLADSLIPQLPDHLRPQVVQKAIGLAIAFLRYPDQLRPIVGVLRVPELIDLYDKLGSVRDPWRRSRSQAIVLNQCGRLHPAQCFTADRALAHEWPGNLDRASLAELIAASAWWLLENGDDEDIREVAEALFDVTDWWP
jgi:hypothetical protein